MVALTFGAFHMYIIAFKSEVENMRRFKYQSKHKHISIVLNVYSLRETVVLWKQDIKKLKDWMHTPKDKRKHKKLIEFKIERK